MKHLLKKTTLFLSVCGGLDAALINYLPFDGTAGAGLESYQTNTSGSSVASFESQNNRTDTYQFANSSPLTYGSLQTTASYGVGGGAFTRSDVTIVANNGSTWANNGNVSSRFSFTNIDRGSLWNSVLLRDDADDDQTMLYSMGTGGGNNTEGANQYLFGISGADNGGYTARYKSDDDTITDQALSLNMATGQTDFLLFNIEFGDGSGDITYNLWINPTLGAGGPGMADFSQSVAWSVFDSNSSDQVGIDSFYFRPGNGNNDGSIDEFRLGKRLRLRYACRPEPSALLPESDGSLMMLPAALQRAGGMHLGS